MIYQLPALMVRKHTLGKRTIIPVRIDKSPTGFTPIGI